MALTLGFIGIVTSDMTVSLAFRRALGITVPASSGDAPHVEAKLSDGTVIAWDNVDVIREFDAGYMVPTGGHRTALAFDMGSPGQVGRVYRGLVTAGHHGHVEPWDAHWGQRYAILHDPDGNSIDLYAWLPATWAGARPTKSRKSRVMCAWSTYPAACTATAKEGFDLGCSSIATRLNQRVTARPAGDPRPGPIRDRARHIRATRTGAP